MIIDAHTHVFKAWNGVNNKAPNASLDYGRIKNGNNVKQVMPPAFERSDCRVENLMANLDAHGVDKAVVFSNGGYGYNNDYLLESLRKYPERLSALALVDITRGRQAADELDKYLGQGFCGYKYEGLTAFEFGEQMPLDHADIMPVWEVLNAHEGVAMFHLSRPNDIDELKHIKRQFPAIKMVIAHFGAEAVFNHYEQNWEKLLSFVKAYDDIWLETSSVSITLKEQISFEKTIAVYEEALRVVGADKIIWGSDYPCMTLYATYYQMLHLILDGLKGVSYDKIEKIVGKNSQNIFFSKTSDMRST